VATRVIELYATRYFDFNVKHFHEKLVSERGYRLSYGWTKRVLQDAGRVKRAKKRGAHRRKRPHKPLPGMMLHQQDLRAAAITTMAAANQYLSEVFLPAHNAAFQVPPAEPVLCSDARTRPVDESGTARIGNR
jgi:hypothetical protein